MAMTEYIIPVFICSCAVAVMIAAAVSIYRESKKW